ncbi:MAG: alpha/beta hydrolase family protein [Gammaproteobacteria bacterium]|nr:alpha/beta hydrolase family protein [Gammaproteobacteria bacterium]
MFGSHSALSVKQIYLGSMLLILSSFAHAVPITLNDGTTDFTAELNTGSTNTGVIFFHGRGQNPNGDVVRQLQNSLNARGHTTLSLSNPLASDGTTNFSSYAANEDILDNLAFARLDVALQAMQSNGIDKLVFAGFSFGARLMTASTAAWNLGLLNTYGMELAGLVGVGMSHTLSGSTPTIANPTTLDDINVLDTIGNLALINTTPVLDIYGSNDTQNANSANSRKNSYAGPAENYEQLSIQCPERNGTYYARNSGNYQIYYNEGLSTESQRVRRCHQLRNGYLFDGVNYVEDVILRGYPDAPLEKTVNNWFINNIEPTAVSEPPSILLMLSGILFILGVYRRK